MTLQEIINTLELNVLTEAKDFASIEAASGYTSDLLSCVMAGAKQKGVWLTLQAHINIVAVAALLDLSAVIITEGALPEQATIDKANVQGIILLSSPLPTFVIAGKLWEMGLRSAA
jgi:predicted transcriptional regulator